MRKSLLGAIVSVLASVAVVSPAAAAVIVEDRTGVTSSRFQFYWGQSFTTPVGTGWNNLSFNFYDLGAVPFALGTGYLFESAYAGAPAGLAAAGALAVSAPADGSTYSFAPGFRLAASTQYFFYQDTPMRLLGNGSADVGGSLVFTSNGSQAFEPAGPGNANFTVNGTAAAVPEPAAWLLLISGFSLIGVMQRRQTAGIVVMRGNRKAD
jgi:hypothetical protein